MKAWEYELKMRKKALPDPEWKIDWTDTENFQIFPNDLVSIMWNSRVPGSGAPESLMVGAVQSVENMGRDVSRAEKLLEDGMNALKDGDYGSLKVITCDIFNELSKAPKIEDHPYHSYERPLEWDDVSKNFPDLEMKIDEKKLKDKVKGGWYGQISGASVGTKLEGYMHDGIVEVYGTRLDDLLSDVSTFNDDVTYEIAFIQAFKRRKLSITSKDVAKEWIRYINFGWSAEYVALENLKRGIFPPESGRRNNPFEEWIGAQMRCMVHGLIAPGKPKQSARLAFLDSVISHSGNGVYGGIHSAVLTSMAFVIDDIRELVERSIEFIPTGSEFEAVVSQLVGWLKENENWEDVLRLVEKRFEKYNWIHLYPNTCAVLTALWYGRGDFDRTMEIVLLFGYDVDCNAGEVGTILGVMNGYSGIPKKWIEPLGGELRTYLRDFRVIDLERFTDEFSKIMLV